MYGPFYPDPFLHIIFSKKVMYDFLDPDPNYVPISKTGLINYSIFSLEIMENLRYRAGLELGG